MNIAGRIGLALALVGVAAGARAQEPGATPDAPTQAEARQRAKEQAERDAERTRERAEREAERAERERERVDRMDEVYENATEQVEEGHYENAVRMFDQVVGQNGQRADASLYWKAYSLHKLGRKADALETLNQLRSAHPKSSWVKEAKALELEIQQGGGGTAPSKQALEDADIRLFAIDALMNTDPAKALPILQKVLRDTQSPKERDRALFVLAQHGSPEARSLMMQVARGEQYPGLQRKAIRYLAISGSAESRQALSDIYQGSSDPSVKKAVLQAFMISGEKGRVLTAAKSETDPAVRRAAIQQLGVMGASDELWQLYASESSSEGKKAIQQALFVGGASGRLIELVKTEKDPELRLSAVRNLGLMGSPEAQAALESLYKNETDLKVREAVLQALFVSGNAKRLIEIAKTEKDPALRRKAIQHLSVMGSPEAQQYLLELLEK